MKKWFIKPNWESCEYWQLFWIFQEWRKTPITTHFCSDSWYAVLDLLRHSVAKEFDIIYWLKWDIVYMNWEISEDDKKGFNDAENMWRNRYYWKTAPTENLL